jgi:hypothetical protein
MPKWADYLVTKLSMQDGLISSIKFHLDLGESVGGEEFERNRDWMVHQVSLGKTFCCVKRNTKGSWNRIGEMTYNGNIFSWFAIPRNITRRKTFVSYYHRDDQIAKQEFENLCEDLIVSKSVEEGDINSDNSAEYIRQLIQSDYLQDTSVLVVLVGPKTKCRKHVDWEISGAISAHVGGISGLLGIILPTHPDYNKERVLPENLPPRLAANVEAGFAILRHWTDDRVQIQNWIEEAFALRSEEDRRRNRSIPQMQRNTCE